MPKRLVPIPIQSLILIPTQIHYEPRHFTLNQNRTFQALIQISYVLDWLFSYPLHSRLTWGCERLSKFHEHSRPSVETEIKL